MQENLSTRFFENKKIVLTELDRALSSVSSEDIDSFVKELMCARKIFFIGVGRVQLSLQAISKRLKHLGFDTHMVGDIEEPAITPKDLLVVGSGSGNSIVPVVIAKKAKSLGARVYHIGSNPDSALKGIVDGMLRIPVRTKLYLEDEIDSQQPMTSLFEQSLLLLGDILAMSILQEKGIDLDELWGYHANLE